LQRQIISKEHPIFSTLFLVSRLYEKVAVFLCGSGDDENHH